VRLSETELDAIATERDSYRNLAADITAAPKGWRGDGVELICIGAAAGAHNVAQGLPSGGFLLRCKGRSLIVDPGANSISFLKRCGINPYELTDIAATHAHNDHVGDLSLAVSAALSVGFGGAPDASIIVCPALVDYVAKRATQHGFTLPAYAFSRHVVAVGPFERAAQRLDGATVEVVRSAALSGGISITATPTQHGTIEGVGFVIETPFGQLGYTGDTGYFPELDRHFAGVSVLWLNINTLGLQQIQDTGETTQDPVEPVCNHLGYIGVCRLIEAIRPRVAIISHFGAQILAARGRIEALLRARFQESPTTIHIAHTGDVFRFPSTLDAAPELDRLQV
jgi:ribonuclease BN (tRNA processing enzyme)